MLYIRFALLSIFVFLSAVPFSLSLAETQAWLLRDVTVIPMTGDAPLPRHDVLVQDDRIVAIEPTGRLDGAFAVIDGNGGYLIPGLTDMHVHLGSPLMLAMYVRSGVTTVRVMNSDERIRDMWSAVETGELFGPRLFVTSPLFEGDPPLWPQSEPVTTPEQARELVGRYAAQGLRAVKIYDGVSEPVLAAAAEAAAELGLPVVGHMPADIPLDALLKYNPASLEHVGGYLPKWFMGERDACDLPVEELEELAQGLAAHGTAVVPTISMYQYGSDPAARDTVRSRPEFAVLPPGLTEAFWEAVTPAPDSDRARRSRCSYLNARRFVAAFVAAGGRLLSGTDTPNPWLIPGYALHNELELFVDLGQSPEQALATATSVAADWFGESAERGTVETGKVADLVLLEANPLEDIRHTRKIVGVAQQGHWLTKDDLDARVATAQLQQ